MRKPTICICENKDADQLRGNREADQRLCFRYLDSTLPLLPKYKISSLKPSPVAVQPGLCQTWSEITLLVFSCHGSNLLNAYANYCKDPKLLTDMSRDVRKPVFGVSDQVRHKPGWLETWNFGFRKQKGLYYPSGENKDADQLRGYLICVFVFAYAKIRFSHVMAHMYWQTVQPQIRLPLEEQYQTSPRGAVWLGSSLIAVPFASFRGITPW